jgi:hypothetical protein
MGATGNPRAVQMFCGIIFASAAPLGSVRSGLEAAFGPIDFESDIFDFNFTDYYEHEMGAGLRKVFFAFEELIPPDFIVDVKIGTNEIEKKHATMAAGVSNRTVNLDPGYMTQAKMVLATTKDFFHRVYISRGIYAEVTLQYKKPSFEPLPWTYPDYKTPEYINFLNRLRKRYCEKLKVDGPV